MKVPVRRRDNCRHCPRRGVPMYGRGLCHYCYYDPFVRPRYDRKARSAGRREWTAKEAAALKAMRRAVPPVTLANCAARLGRSFGSVSQAAARFRCLVVRRDQPAKIEAFLRLRKAQNRTRTDAEIASMIGCSRTAIHRVRRLLGIPRQPSRNRRTGMMRCFSCPASVPTCRSKIDGWAVRKLGRWGENVSEIYCPKCFAKYGWPCPQDHPC